MTYATSDCRFYNPNQLLMKNIFRTSIQAFCFLILTCTIHVSATEKSDLYPSMDGSPNACNPSELEELHKSVIKFAADRAPVNAWNVISTYLCGSKSNAKNLRTMREHITKELLPSIKFIMLEKRVSSVTIENYGKRGIKLKYTPDPSCIGEASLEFNGYGWLITNSSIECC